MLCHELDASHSTKTRKHQRVSQIKHSVVKLPLICKVPTLKSPAITQRRSMCSESSKYQWSKVLIEKYYKFLSSLGLRTEANSYYKRMTTQRCSSGLGHWKLSAIKPVLKVVHKHCQPRHKRMNQNEDPSSLSRKSKHQLTALVCWTFCLIIHCVQIIQNTI